MAKYDEPFEDTQELYDQLLAQTGVGENINVRILANNKAKEIFKVSKCSETEKFKTGDDVNIFLNETIFDQLEPEQKLIIVEESLACIHYDSENSKMVITYMSDNKY